MRTVTKERRKAPDEKSSGLESYLNDDQRFSLQRLENFGWSLKYVRRPLFLEPVAIVYHRDAFSYAVLDIDGTLNCEGDVSLRSPN